MISWRNSDVRLLQHSGLWRAQ